MTSVWSGVSGKGGASAAGAGRLCSAAGGGTSKSGLSLSRVRSKAALIMSRTAAATMRSEILCRPGSSLGLVSAATRACRWMHGATFLGPRRGGLRGAARGSDQVLGRLEGNIANEGGALARRLARLDLSPRDGLPAFSEIGSGKLACQRAPCAAEPRAGPLPSPSLCRAPVA